MAPSGQARLCVSATGAPLPICRAITASATATVATNAKMA
jgi:hypothetical protein